MFISKVHVIHLDEACYEAPSLVTGIDPRPPWVLDNARFTRTIV